MIGPGSDTRLWALLLYGISSEAAVPIDSGQATPPTIADHFPASPSEGDAGSPLTAILIDSLSRKQMRNTQRIR